MGRDLGTAGLARGRLSGDDLAEQALQEVEDEEPRDDPHQRVHLAGAALGDLHHHEHDEAHADADGDRVRERHEGDGEEGRDGLLHPRPLDLGDVGHHQCADDDQHRGDRLGGDQRDHRGRDDRDQEAGAGDERGDAGPGALGDTGDRLDVGGVRGGRAEATEHRGERVDDEDAAQVRRVAVAVEQPALGTDGHHGAHGVEEVRQQQGEDQQDDTQGGEAALGEGAEDVDVAQQLEVGGVPGADHRRVGLPAVDLTTEDGAQRIECLDQNGDKGGDANGDQQAAADIAGVEDGGQQQAEQEDGDRPALQTAVDAEGDRGALRGADHTAVDQADEGDEDADADADGRTHEGRDRLEDGGPEAGEHQDGDQRALEHDQAHRLRPGHDRGQGVGQQGVQAEAGGEGEGITTHDAHQDRHHTGEQCGDGGDRRLGDGDVGVRDRLAGDQVAVDVRDGADDGGVQRDDVRHREERDQSAADLAAQGRPSRGELEPTVQDAAAPLSGGSGCHRG
ncbi:hypothetical protein SDC9_74704 [bioreactor metagenome]|uniref:Uncharacterized protein n=1 Tax=bioreactor metagenome TaxID=1076179 RepID=A0A644YHY0_9ZZZZ